MCGLVGVLSKSVPENVRCAFNDMLYMDVLRGEDSTGVAVVSNAFSQVLQPEVEIFKSVGSTSDFFDDHARASRGRSITNKNASVYLGHNRFATQGVVNEENAHPFEFDNLVGAHNGTVSQWSMRDFHGYKDFNIDSKIIYSHLSYTQDIKEVWKDADGALALVWWDKVNKKLNMARNNQRPLHFCYTDDDKHLLWASESWMIFVAAMRNKLKLKDVVEVKPNTLYTFGVEGDLVRHTQEDIPPFVQKPVYTGYNSGRSQRKEHYLWGEGYDDWADYPSYHNTEKEKNGIRLVIREVHDGGRAPSAIGFTEHGELVTVHVPQSRWKEAKNKIIGRGTNNGYYVAKSLFNSSLMKESYWCNWQQLQYVKLKSGLFIMKKEDNGFEIQGKAKTAVIALPNAAPWFGNNNYLTKEAWELKVQCGCLNCEGVPEWSDNKSLYWASKEDFICGDCKDISYVRSLIEEKENRLVS